MLYGIGPKQIRMLIDDPWEGGRGHGLQEVATWTLDQVLMALTDRKNLSAGRSRTMNPMAVKTDKDGMLAGRAADGTPIRGRIRGKSKCRELMEAEAAKNMNKRRRGRRERRGT